MKYKFKTTPYKHQIQALRKLIANKWGGALLMEPRTGKTKVVVDYASAMRDAGRISRVVVVCPVSVMDVWKKEIALHGPGAHRVLVWDKKARRQKRLPAIRNDGGLDWLIVNYDAFSTPGRRTKSGRRSRTTGKHLFKQLVLDWAPDLMVLDESHRIKSPSAAKTRVLVAMGQKMKYRIICTGTPITKRKRVFDVYSQWKFLNPQRFEHVVDENGRRTFSAFKERYGVWLQREGWEQWIRNRRVGELKRLIHEDSYSVKRADCFDLPPRRDQIVRVELKESFPAYRDMAEEMIHRLEDGEITEASLKIVQILRLAQITGGLAKTTEGELRRVGSEKLKVMEDLLSDWFEAEEKVVVAARFRGDLAALGKLGEKLKVPVWQLHGGIKRADRGVSIDAFRDHDGPALFAMQPAAGSLGIDLRAASIFVWYSLTTSYVDYTQSEDRVALSRKETTFVHLLAGGTVDEVIYEAMKDDGNVAKAIAYDPHRLLSES